MKLLIKFLVVCGMLGCLTNFVLANPQAEEAAIKSAEKWLLLVDNQQYKESYEQAAAEFKKVVNMEDWLEAIRNVRQPLGEIKTRKLLSKQYATVLPNAPSGEYVLIQYVTTFANNDSAIETITPMKDADGQWRVSGYYVRNRE